MSDELDGFEWDDAKSDKCFAKRGFDFAHAVRIWHNQVREREDTRKNYGEVRIQALGRIDGLYFVVVFTWRGESRRIISARQAHMDEVEKWR